MRVLHREDVGSEVRALQLAYNARAKSRGMVEIHADGELGTITLREIDEMGWVLGAGKSTLDRGDVPIGLQRMIRWPRRRTPAQLARAAARKAAKKRLALRQRAHREAMKLIGVMEQGGNNVGEEVETIIRGGGGRRGQPWCGWFCAYVYKLAGSKSVTGAWGAVRLYVPLTGIKRTKTPLSGNLVRFTFDHIGMFVHWCDAQGTKVPRNTATHIKTIEGNTGRSGAVSDSKTGGDGVYVKIRSRKLVRDYLHITR